MTINFEYTLEDVEKEFKELLDSTAGFGRAGADFTVDEYRFRIGQLSSCAKQLKSANPLIEEAIEFEEENKDKFDKFDPRYESRFTAKETFEMDSMLREIIQKYNLTDDDFSHFVLFQALKHLNGDNPDEFEIRIYKEDAVETRNNFNYIKNDFDYIELYFNDDDMAEYAERFYNDGEHNIAVFSRKAFEEYLCDAIFGTFPLVLEKTGYYETRYGTERKVLLNLLEAVPDLDMKYFKGLAEGVSGLLNGLEFNPIQSFNIKELVANGFYAKWMRECLKENLEYSWLKRTVGQAGVKPDFSGMANPINRVYKKWLDWENFSDVKSLVEFTRVKPSAELIQRFYPKWLDAEELNVVSWGIKLSGVKPDRDTMLKFYRHCLDYEELGSLKRGIELSEVNPDDKLMSKYYERWPRGAEYSNITRAIKITGVTPDYTSMSDYIQKKYESMLYFEEFNSASSFARLTGIKPTENVMSMYYKHWLSNDELENVERGINLSGIKPGAELMSEFYKKCLKSHSIKPFERAINISGVVPVADEILDDITECYAVWIEDGSFDKVERGAALTGINPDYLSMEEKVQKGYRVMLYDHNFQDAAKCIKASSINPDAAIMSEFYNYTLGIGDFDSVAEGIELSGIQPDYTEMEDAVKGGYVMRMIFGGSKEVEKGFRLTGIKPQGYVTAVCRFKDKVRGAFGMGDKVKGMNG